MATRKQIEANRRNAQKSTGPVTPEGKAASSMNALKTGLYAESLIIPGENPEDLETLTSEYYDYYNPNNPDFRDLVNDLITAVWQLRRLCATEAEIEKHIHADFWRPEEVEFPRGKAAINNYKQLSAFQRRLESARRAYARARAALREYLEDAPAIHAAIQAAQAIGAAPAAPSDLPAIPLSSLPLTQDWLRSGNPAPDAQEAEVSAPTEPPKAA